MDQYATNKKTVSEAVSGGGLLVVAQWEAKEGQADRIADILARFLPEAQREPGAKLFLQVVVLLFESLFVGADLFLLFLDLLLGDDI